ncbi:MAG: phage virion morphogenesis protein [Candidatus Thermoplasmatota archaeon]|nr:phage virion morphogenesis protein [Candidatus Thermoplasmatota archaeon]
MKVEGLDEVQAALRNALHALTPTGLRDVLADINVVLETRARDSFDQQRAPSIVPDIGKAKGAAKQKWKPLADSTIKRRRTGRKSGSPIPLIDTGTLRRSISTVLGVMETTIGTAVHYGQYHSAGTKRMPARPFIGIDERDVLRLELAIRGHIEGALRRP